MEAKEVLFRIAEAGLEAEVEAAISILEAEVEMTKKNHHKKKKTDATFGGSYRENLVSDC